MPMLFGKRNQRLDKLNLFLTFTEEDLSKWFSILNRLAGRMFQARMTYGNGLLINHRIMFADQRRSCILQESVDNVHVEGPTVVDRIVFLLCVNSNGRLRTVSV